MLNKKHLIASTPIETGVVKSDSKKILRSQ